MKETTYMLILMLIALAVLAFGYFVAIPALYSDFSQSDQFAHYIHERDANCTECLLENNYTCGKVNDYQNLTPYIRNKCPDCRELELVNTAATDALK